MTHEADVLVVGGGNAGVSLAARLLRLGGSGAWEVTLVESQQTHRYRPLLNYVGSGEARMRSLERPARRVVPDGCTWLQDEVVVVDPGEQCAWTRQGEQVRYRDLVVCPGLEEDWDAVPGLREAYDAGWAGSTFVVGSVERVWPALREVRGGTVVFTVPPEPAPCGATALKPLFMACDHWRRTGVLGSVDVRLVLPGQELTGLASADEHLEQALAAYGVEVVRRSRVVGLDAEHRRVDVAAADPGADPSADAGRIVVDDVTYAHVVPPYRAPSWIGSSGLAGASPAGLVDVDPETMRHRRHTGVWSLGDVADLGIRPSGGALRKQVEVLAGNIVAARNGGELRRYDGYTVMPITTSRRRLLLAEVDRDGRPTPTVPFPDLTRPRRTTWLFDRYGLPLTYYYRILRGKV